MDCLNKMWKWQSDQSFWEFKCDLERGINKKKDEKHAWLSFPTGIFQAGMTVLMQDINYCTEMLLLILFSLINKPMYLQMLN